MVLAPDVAEPGFDVLRVIDLGPATGQQPEQPNELERDEKEGEQQLCEQRQPAPKRGWEPNQRPHRGGVPRRGEDDGQQTDPEQPLQRAGQPESGPVRQSTLPSALEPAEDPVDPEAVVAGPVLTDQEVDLAQDLDSGQRQQPPARLGGPTDRLRDGQQRVVELGRHEEYEEHGEEQEEFHPVPERQVFATAGDTGFARTVLYPRAGIARTVFQYLRHPESLTVNDLTALSISSKFAT